MKQAIFLFCFLIIGSFDLYAQDEQTDRNKLQLNLLIAEYGEFMNTISLDSPVEMDSLFNDYEKKWLQYVQDSLGLSSNSSGPEKLSVNNELRTDNVVLTIDPYNYFILVFSIKEPEDQLRYHLVKNYMLPALKADITALEDEPQLLSNRLLWIGSVANTFSLASYFYDDGHLINELCSVNDRLRILLKNPGETVPENIQSSYDKISVLLELEKYDLLAKKYYVNSEYDKAFQAFVTGVSSGRYPDHSIKRFANSLVDNLTANGRKDEAITVLNSLMYSTGSDLISREVLGEWFTEVDSIRGPELFERGLIAMSGNLLKSAERKLEPVPVDWQYLANEVNPAHLNSAKYILLDFWNTACGPCIKEIPDLNKLNEKLVARDDIVFISVNTDHFETTRSSSDIIQEIQKRQIAYPVVFDDQQTQLSEFLNIKAYPTKLIIDAKGNLLEKVDGSEVTLNTFYELLKDN